MEWHGKQYASFFSSGESFDDLEDSRWVFLYVWEVCESEYPLGHHYL